MAAWEGLRRHIEGSRRAESAHRLRCRARRTEDVGRRRVGRRERWCQPPDPFFNERHGGGILPPTGPGGLCGDSEADGEDDWENQPLGTMSGSTTSRQCDCPSASNYA